MSGFPEALGLVIAAVVGDEYCSESGNSCQVSPADVSEIAKLTAVARQHNARILPVGLGGRRTPPTDSPQPQILLNMRRLNHVLSLDELSLVAHVQAGLSGLELEKILNKRGLTLGDFAPIALDSSVGGLLSVRTPGKSSRRHGTFEDTVLGLSAVLIDGRTVHTRVAPRSATGPDLARVLCGSEGTLGIITSAKVRLHKLPESRLLAAYNLPNFSEALTAVRLALREEAAPAALRVYDSAEADLLLGKHACNVGEAILVAATVGPTSLATCDRNLIASAVGAVDGYPAEEALAIAWWNRRMGQVTDDIAAPNLQLSATPRVLGGAYEAVTAAAKEAGLQSRAHGSRFGRDGGVLFFSISANGEMLEPDDSRLQSLKDGAVSAGAYLLGKSNPSLQEYLDSLRDALDPDRHLNPSILGAPLSPAPAKLTGLDTEQS